MTDPSTHSARQRLAEQTSKARHILSSGEEAIGSGGYAGYCGQLEASLELLCDAAEDVLDDKSGVAQPGGGWIDGPMT
jgi:hypothetical protein